MSVAPQFTDKVTTVPADWANAVSELTYTVFNEATTVVDARNALGLGTLALQNFSNVGITGGSIDGTSIGGLNPMTARFTSVTVTQLNPVLPNNLTSKQYVDTSITNAINNVLAGQISPAVLAGKVNKSGDIMTGPLILYGNPNGSLQAAPKQYVDAIRTDLAVANDPTKGAGLVGYNSSTVQAALDSFGFLLTAKAAGSVFAGPVTGASAAPAFRALAVTDLPFAGQADGVATLDTAGKVPLAQIPDSLLKASLFQGEWDASTNIPALSSGIGTSGYFYKCATAGTTTLDGVTDWAIGDFAFFDGTSWNKIHGSATEVYTVAGRYGDVVLTYQDIGGLATVAHSGSFADLTNIPKATVSSLGLIQVGANLAIDANGVLSATSQPLTPATATTLGGVKIGAGINVTADGTISSGIVQGILSVNSVGTGNTLVADNGTTNSQAKIKSLAAGSNITISAPDANTLSIAATVPVQSVNGLAGNITIQASDNNSATGTSLIADSGGTTGNIKLRTLVAGTGISISSDISGNLLVASSGGYTLPPATTSTLGGVIVGSNLAVDGSGVLSYTMPAATTTTIGGVVVGNNLSITGNVLSVPIATTSVAGVVKAGTGLSVAADGTLSVTVAGGVTSVNNKSGAVQITGIGSVTVDNSGSGIVISSSSGISDAPNDNNLYGRKNQAWALMPDVTQALTAVNSAGNVNSVSLVFNPSVNNAAQLKGIIAGTGVSFTDDGAGNITIAAAANGFVTSVNTKTPDASGAVTITASDVSALPLIGGVMSGNINMNSVATISNLPAPVSSGDAVPYSTLTSLVIDNGSYNPAGVGASGSLNIPISHLRSSVAGAVPAAGQLLTGQIALNTADRALYTKSSGGSIVKIGVSPSDLATVATTGSYNDLLDKPNISSQYVLPAATTTALGGVIVSTGLAVDASGHLTNAGVLSINTRSGAVTLSATDVGLPTDLLSGPSGTVATKYLPAALTGGLSYQGTWDASTNTPTLANGGVAGGTAQANGAYYVVSVAGTTSIDGINTWNVGDLALVSNNLWTRIANSGTTVSQINGKTGNVTLTANDITGISTVGKTGNYSDLSGAPVLATVATTGLYSSLSGTPTLATVATTGNYSDLIGLPPDTTQAQIGCSASGSPVIISPLTFTFARSVTFAANMSGSVGYATLNSGDTTGTFAIHKLNAAGVDQGAIGTLTFTAGVGATFTVSGTTSFAIGESVSFVPTTTNIQYCSFTLHGTYTS